MSCRVRFPESGVSLVKNTINLLTEYCFQKIYISKLWFENISKQPLWFRQFCIFIRCDQFCIFRPLPIQ